MNKYQKALEYLYNLQKYGIKFGLSSTKNLLKGFGNPLKSQNYIHIAGTNGKGSVANFIASVLKEAGYRVGLYTSPHLVRFTERIKINSEEISKQEVEELIEELKKIIVEDEPPTFFEAVTAMALTYFSRKKTHISIIEVGMGGRLDATNIITPLISIITNISYDHKQFLGNTLKEIAYEKAGIIKDSIPVVTGATDEALRVIEEICKYKNSKLFVMGKDFYIKKENGKLVYVGIRKKLKDLKISLMGEHQHINASLALAAIELLKEMGWRINQEHIYKGLKNIKWPGRFHIISKNPLIVLDGAHNIEAMKKLKECVRSLLTYKKAILIIGIMEDKEISNMLQEILEIADHVIFSSPTYSRAASPQTLMSLSNGFKGKKEVITPLSKAIEKALQLAYKNDLILICGSLFTVAEALSYLKPKEYVPDF